MEYVRHTRVVAQHTTTTSTWETVTEFDGDPVKYLRSLEVINEDTVATLQFRLGASGAAVPITPNDRSWKEPMPDAGELVIDDSTKLQVSFGASGKSARIVAYVRQ